MKRAWKADAPLLWRGLFSGLHFFGERPHSLSSAKYNGRDIYTRSGGPVCVLAMNAFNSSH